MSTPQTDSSKAELGTGATGFTYGQSKLAKVQEQVKGAEELVAKLAADPNHDPKILATAKEDLAHRKRALTAWLEREKTRKASVKAHARQTARERAGGNSVSDAHKRPTKPNVEREKPDIFQFGNLDIEAQEAALRKKQQAEKEEKKRAANKKIPRPPKPSSKPQAPVQKAAASTALAIIRESPVTSSALVQVDEKTEELKRLVAEARAHKESADQAAAHAAAQSAARAAAEAAAEQQKKIAQDAQNALKQITHEKEVQMKLLTHKEQTDVVRAQENIMALSTESNRVVADLQARLNSSLAHSTRLEANLQSAFGDIERLRKEKQNIIEQIKNTSADIELEKESLRLYAAQMEQHSKNQVAAVKAEIELISSQARSVAADAEATIARLNQEIKDLRQLTINQQSDAQETNRQLFNTQVLLGKEREAFQKHAHAAELHIAELTKRVAAHGVELQGRSKPPPPTPMKGIATYIQPAVQVPRIRAKPAGSRYRHAVMGYNGTDRSGGSLPKGLMGSESLYRYLHG